MLALLSLTILIFMLLVNLTGLTLVVRRVVPNYLLAKVVAPVLLCLAGFWLEHSVGLGGLPVVRTLATVFFLWLVWNERQTLRAHWATELLFLAGFFYPLLWGFCFPNIDGQSEKLTDLTFIGNYLSGSRLPPVDRWLPPYHFDVYYGFQYYSSALLGRVLQLGPGTTYRLSLCVIVALTITAAGGVVFLLGGRHKRGLLPLAALVLGGTGASWLVPFMGNNIVLSDGMRFIGGFAIPEKATTGLGKWLVGVSGVPAKDALQLPAETFGYLIYLGDHHPPMSGFLLLALALLAIVIAEKECELRVAPAIAALTIPLVVVSDAWNLPLQVLLVAGWIGWRCLRRVAVPWTALAAGAAGGLFFTYPFLSSFAWRSLDYGVRFRLVPGMEHTPPLLGLILFAPYLLLVGVTLVAEERDESALWWCLFWLGLLGLTEIFYVDDIYSGPFNRFNSTLKWWPAIMAGILITVGPLALRARSRINRWGGALAMLTLCAFAIPLGTHLVTTPKPHLGRIDGAAWIQADRAEKPLLEYLKLQPPGIVLQRLEADAFTPAPGLIVFSGQTAFLGWPAHENLWRGYRADIELRSAQVKQFYRGELPDSAAWLLENEIDHVLWLKTEAALPPGTCDKIEAQIREAYFWREYYRVGDFRVGVWSRRSHGKPAPLATPVLPPVPQEAPKPSGA
jgi:uncharacterized membrane protein